MRRDKVGQADRQEGKKDKDITALTDRSHMRSSAPLPAGNTPKEEWNKRGEDEGEKGNDKPAYLFGIAEVEELGCHMCLSPPLLFWLVLFFFHLSTLSGVFPPISPSAAISLFYPHLLSRLNPFEFFFAASFNSLLLF